MKITRTAFFGALLAPVAIAKCSPVQLVAESDVNAGPIVRGTRVILDGVDIADKCYRAEQYSDGTLIAYCYDKDKAGDFIFAAPGKVGKHVVQGKGRIVFP